MPNAAPLRIPLEISPGSGTAPRVFRIATAIQPFRLRLDDGLPDEPEWLRGPMRVRFRLPGATQDVECQARALELILDEGSERERGARAALDLTGLSPEAAADIERYVEERLLQS